jgi:hypothetical protein
VSGLLNHILGEIFKGRIRQIHRFMERGMEVQEQQLTQLLSMARHTQWGKIYGYQDLHNVEQYQQRVPLSSYEDLSPYIERMMQGEQNLLWPSPIRWFSKSSGTTNARSKFLPVSVEALHRCHYQGGRDMITLFFYNRPQSRIFSGRSLAIGGSLQRYDTRKDIMVGDVSAIIMKNLPIWAQRFRTPSIDIALMGEWEEKIEKLAHHTMVQNVTTMQGVPTWIVVLLDRILELTGKQHILEVWPHFEVFCHGAVSFEPYRELFRNKYFPAPQVDYMEVYNASEGYFGLQDDISLSQMLLMLDYGVFYEFIPAEEAETDNPRVLTLDQVEAGKNYALVISTNAGLWRYKIGDTLKFTSVNPYRFKISGRTKHFINAFGEEVIVENADMAIARASEATRAVISNYTAAPVYMADKKRGGHEWIVEFVREPVNLEHFIQVLDETLREVNSDYDAKRYKDIALQAPIVHAVPEGTFYNWLKKRNKLGGQHKVPRLSNSREYLDDILGMTQIIGH